MAQPLGLNFRVDAPSRFFEGTEGLVSPPLALTSIDGVDANVKIAEAALAFGK